QPERSPTFQVHLMRPRPASRPGLIFRIGATATRRSLPVTGRHWDSTWKRIFWQSTAVASGGDSLRQFVWKIDRFIRLSMPIDVIEPQPPDPSWPRYSHRPFPSYRFIPGRSPHPRRDPQGHSYGQIEAEPVLLGPEQWRGADEYLYGIDLYNY